MAVRINALKVAFSTAALALLIGALAVTGSFGAANAGAADVFVPGRVYTFTGGKTTLKLNDRMIRKLKRAKVRVKPTGSAKGGLRKLVLPVTGGRVGIKDGELIGKIAHRRSGIDWGSNKPGGGGTGQVRLRNPVVDMADFTIWGRFYAVPEIEDEVIVVFALSGVEALQSQDGSIRIRAEVELTKRGAKLLRKRLGVRARASVDFGDVVIIRE